MTDQNAPRLAVIGCGAVVEQHLLPALRRNKWLPSVLIDASPTRRGIVARRMGAAGKSVMQDDRWLPLAGEFDAAIVAVPHTLHGPIGRSLLESGKHVFMEKPLATSSEQCRQQIAASKVSGRCLTAGLLRRYLHVAQWTKALIEFGILGRIVRFEAREGFVYNWATSSDSFLRRDLAGGGVLMDTGAHTLDLLLWWFGEMNVIEFRDDSEGGVESDCMVEVQLASGARGRVVLSRGRELSNTVRIEGTAGFVEVHLYRNEIIAASPNVRAAKCGGIDPAAMKPQLFPELFDAELANFRAAIDGKPNAMVPAEEAMRSVELIERCYAVRQNLVESWAAKPGNAIVAHPELRGSTVVVTGATGFIGGRLAERLTREYGARVRCIVRDVGRSVRLARLPVDIVCGDLADEALVKRVVNGADYVFHCAYDVRSRDQNVRAVENLLAACELHAAKLVHVSTFSVYEPFPDGSLTEETRDGDRALAYTDIKLELETKVLDAAVRGRVSATIVQPTIVYGPFSKPWTNAIAEMLIFGKPVLPDAGEGLCNPIYIDDLVDGMMLAATHPRSAGQRFIMSGPEPVTWAEFFGAFAHSLRVPRPELWPCEQISRQNHGLVRDVKLVVANPKRIIQILVRWPAVRQILQTGLEAMPKALRELVNRYYFGSGNARRLGETILPTPQTLALYTAKAVVTFRESAPAAGIFSQLRLCRRDAAHPFLSALGVWRFAPYSESERHGMGRRQNLGFRRPRACELVVTRPPVGQSSAKPDGIAFLRRVRCTPYRQGCQPHTTISMRGEIRFDGRTGAAVETAQ